ncbi:MAG: flavin reductase [Rhodospirillales bacterium]|nr:MAG: flavin reductase [Rhodospirillales bacterium]
MTVDSQDFRDALSRFASGVTVITGLDSDGTPVGVTVSAFASLSLDPPLVLFCLGLRTAKLDAYASHGAVAVNILAEDQHAVSELFASQRTDKFATVGFCQGDNGCAVLDGCLASLECAIVNSHVGGDHLAIIGRVERVHRGVAAAPLLRFRGRYAALGNPGS